MFDLKNAADARNDIASLTREGAKAGLAAGAVDALVVGILPHLPKKVQKVARRLGSNAQTLIVAGLLALVAAGVDGEIADRFEAAAKLAYRHAAGEVTRTFAHRLLPVVTKVIGGAAGNGGILGCFEQPAAE